MGLMINKINVWIGGRTRTFFGWTHANMMGLDFLLLAMDIMYLRKECKKWYDCILYAGFIIFLDLTANSRTAEAVIAMLIVIHLLSIVIPKTGFINDGTIYIRSISSMCLYSIYRKLFIYPQTGIIFTT